MSLLHIIATPTVASDSSNNPDGYAMASNTYVSKDYETEVGGDVEQDTDIMDLTWGSTQGYNSTGAWKLEPKYTTVNENNAGIAAPTVNVDQTQTMFVSYLIKMSTDLLSEMLNNAVEGKMHDAYMWDSTGTTREDTTRQTVFCSVETKTAESAGVHLSIVDGGAGTLYFDETNNPDLTDYANVWVWVMTVYHADTSTPADGYTRIYIKTESGANSNGVTRALHRDGDWNSEQFTYTTRGWWTPGQLWGYWDDLSLGSWTGDEHMIFDRLRVTDGWVNPPF